jgi:hypothetical protein
MYDEVALTCVIPSLLSIGPRTQNSAVPVETFYVWGLFVPLPTVPVASEFIIQYDYRYCILLPPHPTHNSTVETSTGTGRNLLCLGLLVPFSLLPSSSLVSLRMLLRVYSYIISPLECSALRPFFAGLPTPPKQIQATTIVVLRGVWTIYYRSRIHSTASRLHHGG